MNKYYRGDGFENWFYKAYGTALAGKIQIEARAPAADGFCCWLVAQSPKVQNEIRALAAERYNFPGEKCYIPDFDHKENLPALCESNFPEVRFHAKLLTLGYLRNTGKQRGIKAKDPRTYLFILEENTRRHPRRSAYFVDAGQAARILGVSKRAFEKRRAAGVYPDDLGRRQVNKRVVIFNGELVAESAIAELAARMKPARP